MCVCVCFEGEGDLLTFYKSLVLLFFFRHERVSVKFFLALLPVGKYSSDTHFTCYCLGMFQN